MALRQRSVAVDVVVDMLDGWRRHQSGRNASLLSFFFFLSIFPLLLVATTILGFVLQNNETSSSASSTAPSTRSRCWANNSPTTPPHSTAACGCSSQVC